MHTVIVKRKPTKGCSGLFKNKWITQFYTSCNQKIINLCYL